MRDVTEFLTSIDSQPNLGSLDATVTYQDSCHLAHGQRYANRRVNLVAAIPGLAFRECRAPTSAAAGAGIYNVVQNEMSMQILAPKMAAVNSTGAQIIATANRDACCSFRPGCGFRARASA